MSAYRIEFYLLGDPFAVVHLATVTDPGRAQVPEISRVPEISQPSPYEPVIQPLDELPPERLLY